MQAILVIALIFSIIIAVFAVQNTQSVPVNFLTFQTQPVSASILVLASAAVGAILTFLFGMWRTVRSSLTIRGDKKRIEEQERTILELRQSNERIQENLRRLQQENERLKSRQVGGSPGATVTTSTSTPSATVTGAVGEPSGTGIKGPGISDRSGPARPAV